MNYDIRLFHLKGASEAEYAAMNAFSNHMRHERLPDDPPIPLEEEIARCRSMPEAICFTSLAAWQRDGSGIVGNGRVSFWRTEENKHVVDFGIDVLPEFRRQGIARELLAKLVEVPVKENRRLMLTNTTERVPAGETFMQRLGAQRGLEEHTNQLDLSELNQDLIRQWQERAPQRASDYELGFWDGAYPEEELESVCRLIEVMNTAPRGALEVEDFKVLPEHLRQWEESAFTTGTQRWTMYVREKATGKFAGFTDVYWNPNRPHILGQGGTGVFPEHRSRGLGRWLKSAMLDKVLRERPQVRFVRTGNADSNEPMLKINYELGFKPYISECIWQVETEKVLAYLDS